MSVSSVHTARSQPVVRDQRVTTRVGVELPVRLKLLGSSVLFDAATRNLGANGLCLRTGSPFALEDVEYVEIEIEQELYTLMGRGRWQREDLCEGAVVTGISFEAMAPDLRRRIWRWVQHEAIELARFVHEESEIRNLELVDARDIALFTSLKIVPAGHRVYRQGEPGMDSIFILRKGEIVREASVTRPHEVWIETVREGGVFGGLPLLTGLPHTDSAYAERDSVLLEIDVQTLDYMGRALPALARRLSRCLFQKQALEVHSLAERLAAASSKAIEGAK